jgi:hypothetical protein
MLEHTIEGCQCEGKKCSRCNDNKLKCYGMFFSNKARSDGLSVYCKDHDRAYRRAYIDTHKDKINMQAKERYHTPDQMAKKRLYYQEHKDQILQDRKEYASANADHIREYRRSPKVKERARIRARNRYHQPEIYQRIRAYRNRPDIKERERVQWQIYYRKPDIRGRYLNRDRLRRRLPDVQERERAYRLRPEIREQTRIRNQKHERKRRLRPEWPEYRRARDYTRRARKNAVQGVHTPDQIQEQLKRQKYCCYYAACGFSKFPKVNGRYIYHVEHTFPLSRVAGTKIPGNDMGYIVLSCKDCNERKGNKFPWEFPEGGRLF